MERVTKKTFCSHCGEPCPTDRFAFDDKVFCCEGCRMVYQLLDRNGLCTYYQLNDRPGQNRRMPVREDKFAFLDDKKMAARLVVFHNETETHAQFYLPAIHCSSCLYLLENLHRLDTSVVSSRIDFAAKEGTVVFDHQRLSLRQIAELLTSIGYEPYISLHDLGSSKSKPDRRLIYRLGVAGFCFGNIMLLSFPEYLGLDKSESTLRQVFRYLGLLLSLPVLLYSAQPFFSSAWKGLRGKFLNIDAPIALAILVTFSRSAWEVGSGAGSGFLDSMSGIVFFMLAGRVLQDRTYRQLSFDRDYTSYFPMAVTVLQTTGSQTSQKATSLPDLRCGDTLLIRNGELIPADGILTRGKALIDYSFVTGESLPETREVGEIVYAGGRQTGGAIEVLVIKEVAQSYLTQLWNRQPDSRTSEGVSDKSRSFIHALSRNFTIIVLVVAVSAAIYWQLHDPARTWNAVTAVLIVACPCALLLSSTFTNGNLLRILSRHHFYLRNAETIERIAATTHVVFDKTGTLTDTSTLDIDWHGVLLCPDHLQAIAALAAQSTHPMSRVLATHITSPRPFPSVQKFLETVGSGIEGEINGHRLVIGSLAFVSDALKSAPPGLAAAAKSRSPQVFVASDRHLLGSFHFSTRYRRGLDVLADSLSRRLRLTVLSGDRPRDVGHLKEMLGKDTDLQFDQSPGSKSNYVSRLQQQGEKVMMIGDGLNDAGALRQSEVGIAVTADCSNFTPASDAILRADQLANLPAFIGLCRAGRRIILASFILSILYNIVGLFFAVRSSLSPLVAAILMPASSLSILLVTYGTSNLLAFRLMRKIMPSADQAQAVEVTH